MAEQERAIRTRRAILEAAATVFDEQGYDAANVAEILSRAGVTKGAMYFHFSSKEALAEAVMLEQSRELPASLPGSPLQTMIDLTQHVGLELRRNPMMRAGIRLATEQGSFRSHGAPAYLDWIKILEQHLEQAKTLGEVLPDTSTKETAEFLVGSFTGLQMLSQELSDHADLQPRIVTLWNYVLPHIADPEILPQLRLVALDADAQCD
jgi:AcrR family transcriptional regulator